MNPDAPQAIPTAQPESNSDIPGLVHGGANQETNNATATNPGAEIPTQSQDTANTSAGNAEVGTPSAAVPPSEFRATPSPGKGPFANEQATSNASATTPSAEIPTQSPETTNAATTPAAAPGLEETPKPIENPTPQTNEQPATTPEANAVTQDTPTQIDASGTAQTPSENASADFSETPTEQAETDNQAAPQADQAQAEANAAAAMHIKKAPINLEPQEFSQEAETENSTFATIEEVNTEAARGFAQIKGTHYEEPFLKGYSEAVKEALLHSKKSD